jgi:LexA-binding, inner membrane-associated putative hydrolase
MFIGHFAPAFVAAAAYSKGPKLATYFVAALLVDWGFFILAMVGVEKMRIEPGATAMVPFDLYHLPFTHSLLGAGIWAAVFGIVIAIWHRDTIAGMLIAAVVASHWVLDWVTHRPDLTLSGSGETYGLGLWNYPEIAMPLEIGIVLAAFLFYIKRSRGPIVQPLVLLITLLGFQAVNWFGPQPTTAGLFLYLEALFAFAALTGLAMWVGKNRYFTQAGGLAAASV